MPLNIHSVYIFNKRWYSNHTIPNRFVVVEELFQDLLLWNWHLILSKWFWASSRCVLFFNNVTKLVLSQHFKASLVTFNFSTSTSAGLPWISFAHACSMILLKPHSLAQTKAQSSTIWMVWLKLFFFLKFTVCWFNYGFSHEIWYLIFLL